MISIVCIYNNEAILNEYLLKSLENQTVKFELIKIANTKNTFNSAAEALNYSAEKAIGRYIMFVHQDVHLLTQGWLEKAEEILDKISYLGIAGVAGMRKIGISKIYPVGTIPKESGIGRVYHNYNKEPWRCNKNFQEPIEVQTLDEQLLIIPRNVFNNFKFDEKVCDNWHLYGVDYSLSVRKIGLKCYILPLPVWHKSIGALNEKYYITLSKIFKKYRNEGVICTTCGIWYTSNFLNCLDLAKKAIRSEIGRWVGRNNVGAVPHIERMKLLLGLRNE